LKKLVLYKRKGQGNSTKIYVKNFISVFRNGNSKLTRNENQNLQKVKTKNVKFEKSRISIVQ